MKSLVALVIGVAAGIAPVRAEILHTERSLYRNIFVHEEGGQRCMRFGRNGLLRQSCITLSDPDTMVFEYTKMAMGALYLNPTPKRILIIGLGGGTLPRTFQKLFPDIVMDVAEIDPAVTRMAKQYFSFVPAVGTHVAEQDGRVYVKRALQAGKTYDLVILDAFDHQYIPEHLLTVEFLREVKGVLAPNGVLAANTFATSRLYDSESATYHTVFGPFFNLASASRVILARMSGLPDQAELARNADALEERLAAFGTGKAFLLPKFEISERSPPNVRVLTDQYSPANLLNEE